MISRYRALISFFIAGLICCPASAAQDLIQVPAAMHLSSDISDGDLSLNELAGLAEQNGLKAVVLGDHYDVRVRYGLPPLRNILRRSVSGPSVSRFGVRHYLDEVRKVRQQHPGLVIVPGVEHTSHYYWSGSPFNGTLQLNNWHKHLLITGLDEQGFKNLPSPENNCGGAAEFDPLSLWPLLLLFAGLVCLKKRSVDYRQVFGISCGPYSQCWRRLGLVLIAVSAVFLINNFPFTKPCYSLYAPAIGGGPYQKVIDYVNKNGGTVFWAHPEADYKGHRGKVAFRTRDYEQELLRLKDYTGFALY